MGFLGRGRARSTWWAGLYGTWRGFPWWVGPWGSRGAADGSWGGLGAALGLRWGRGGAGHGRALVGAERVCVVRLGLHSCLAWVTLAAWHK
jgi:hypothetical protein